MSRGKRICAELKQIRRTIAEENGIPLEIPECTYQGECRGSCPRCESEVRYLERQLLQRIKMGRVATVAGVAVSLASLTACGGKTTDLSMLDVDEWTSAVKMEDVPNVEGMIQTGVVDEVLNDYVDEISGDTVYILVDEEPEFPGGIDALMTFLQANIQYPEEAMKKNIQGKVFVSFVVEKDGSISFPKVMRDIGGGCGQEAIRVLRAMPRWNPGKQGGKPVRVEYNLPVKFSLSEE